MKTHDLLRELDLEKNYADSMAGMADYWMRRAQSAERCAAVLIFAAGGEISVPTNDLADVDRLVVERTERLDDLTTRFRAYRAPEKPLAT